MKEPVDALDDVLVVGSGSGALRCQRMPSTTPRAYPIPVILVHGGAHSAACWRGTPDGRPGWCAHFRERGYDVVLVDWIENGQPRSDLIEQHPADVVESLTVLLERIGPGILVGHSLGGALTIKAVERAPDLAHAVVLLAPPAVQQPNRAAPVAPPGELVMPSPEAVAERFANSPQFPAEALDRYLDSLVPYSAHMRNAVLGITADLRIDSSRAGVWRSIPTLVVLAETDQSVPLTAAREAASAIGATPIVLGPDWGLPDHGHMFIIEHGSDAIAAKVLDWLDHRKRALP